MADYTSLYQSLATKTAQSLQGGVTIPFGLMGKQRALGDAVEGAIVERFAEICAEFSSEVQVEFSNRALEDVAFRYDGRYFAVDVKTHNLDARFSMPNLISVDRLLRFYDDPDNYFVLAMVKYRVISPGQAGNQLAGVGIEEVVISDIEHIAWQSLTIGALGTGQMQIKDASKLTLNYNSDRQSWMRELLARLVKFYEGEITKNSKRLEQAQRRLAELESRGLG